MRGAGRTPPCGLSRPRAGRLAPDSLPRDPRPPARPGAASTPLPLHPSLCIPFPALLPTAFPSPLSEPWRPSDRSPGMPSSLITPAWVPRASSPEIPSAPISGLWEPHGKPLSLPRALFPWAAVHASSWPFWLDHDDLSVLSHGSQSPISLWVSAPAAQVELALGAPPRCFATAREPPTTRNSLPAPDLRSCPHRPKPRAERGPPLGQRRELNTAALGLDSAPALPKSCIQIPVVTELGGLSVVERERLKLGVSECVCVCVCVCV